MTQERKRRDLGFKLEDLLKEGEKAASAIGTAMGTSPDLAKRNSLTASSVVAQQSTSEASDLSELGDTNAPRARASASITSAKATMGRPKQDLRDPEHVCRTVLYLSEDILQIAKIKAIEEKTRPSVIIDELLRRIWLGSER